MYASFGLRVSCFKFLTSNYSIMSQEQPKRDEQEEGQGLQASPIRYGDVFPVAGDLADQAVAPRDAAMMQSAETRVYGQTPKGGPASVMEAAAAYNEQSGAVGHEQFSDVPGSQGVSITQTAIPGRPDQRLVTEFVAGQAVGQYVVGVGGGEGNQGGQADEASAGGGVGSGGVGGDRTAGAGAREMWTDKITIGEALEATARTAGEKPVEPSDAAAIAAAEATATGINAVLPGGVGEAAQVAADANAWVDREEAKTKLGDVLEDATARIIADKEATRANAEVVLGAEIRTSARVDRHPGGVGAAVAAAARLNENAT